MTREQLAEKIGKSKNTVGRYERGQTMPDVSETWRLAEALGITLTELISRAEQQVRLMADPSTTPLDELEHQIDAHVEADDIDELAAKRKQYRQADADGTLLPSKELGNVAKTRADDRKEELAPNPEGSE